MRETILVETAVPLAGAGTTWLYSDGFNLHTEDSGFAVTVKYTQGNEDGLVWYVEWQADGNDPWHKMAAYTGVSPAGTQNLLPIKGYWDKTDAESPSDYLIFRFPVTPNQCIPGSYRIKIQANTAPAANPGTVELGLVEVEF